MEIQKRKYGSFSSSINPEKLSLTIKSLAVFIPSILVLTSLANINITESDLNNVITSALGLLTTVTSIISAGTALFGALRKVYVAINNRFKKP